jgi:hypothetical protein
MSACTRITRSWDIGQQRARIVSALIACVILTHVAGSSAAPFGSIGAIELPVVVSERPGVVRLRVLLPDDVPPGSIEVQVAGRSVVVLGQTVGGGQRRSRLLRVSQAVVEEGAQAALESDGSLTVILRGSAVGETAGEGSMRRDVPRERRP